MPRSDRLLCSVAVGLGPMRTLVQSSPPLAAPVFRSRRSQRDTVWIRSGSIIGSDAGWWHHPLPTRLNEPVERYPYGIASPALIGMSPPIVQLLADARAQEPDRM